MATQPPSDPNPALRALYALDQAAYAAWQSIRSALSDPGRRRIALAGVGLLAISTLALIIGSWDRSDEPMTRVQLTDSGEDSRVRGAALSPDGATLAYADAKGLHLVTLENLETRPVALPDGMLVEEMAWAPNGERIYFVGRHLAGFDRSLWVLRLPAASPRRLREGAHSPAVSPDGTTIAFVQEQALGKAIWIMDAGGKDPRALFDDRRFNYEHPAWSPDGRLAFVRVRPDMTGAEIVTLPAGGGEPVLAIFDFDPRTGPCWTPDGDLVFGRAERNGASLWSVPINPKSGEPGERSHILDEDGVAYFTGLSIDHEGRRLGFVPVRIQVDAYITELKDNRPLGSFRRVGAGSGDHWPVAWTDDGSSLYLRQKRDEQTDVVVQPVDGGESRSVAPGFLLARTPDGSVLFETPDGAGLMRASHPGGETTLMGRPPGRTNDSGSALRCPQKPGRGCVVAVEKGDALQFHEFAPHKPSGLGKRLTRVGLTGRDYGWNISPDGNRVALVNGGRTIKLVNLGTGGLRKLRIAPSIYSDSVAWSANGRALFVSGMVLHSSGGYVLYRVDLSGATQLLWQTTDRWFAEPVPSPDGKRVALAARTVEGDAWMLEHF